MLFQTNRLIIRKLTTTDFPHFHEMESNPNVLKYTGSPLKTKAEIEQNLQEVISKYDDPENDFWIYAVISKETEELVGTCALVSPHPKFGWEIGYRFLERHWGQGYASEIMTGILRYAFTQFGAEKLFADADVLNVASIKILEKEMNFHSEYLNTTDQCTDRKYTLNATQWENRTKL